MKATTFLKRQHQALRKKLSKAGGGPSERRRELTEEVSGELERHGRLEEDLFYPALRSAAPETAPELHEALEVHRVMARLVYDLRRLDPAEAQFDAKLAVLRDTLKRHVSSVEGAIFEAAKKRIADGELRELGDRLDALDRDLQQNPPPRPVADEPPPAAEASPAEPQPEPRPKTGTSGYEA